MANCFWLLMHWTRLAVALARASAGSSKAARIPMMAITTSNSMRVKPQLPFLEARMISPGRDFCTCFSPGLQAPKRRGEMLPSRDLELLLLSLFPHPFADGCKHDFRGTR